MPATERRIPTFVFPLLLALAAGCSDGSGGDAGGGPGVPSTPECDGEAFASTFEGIQQVVFEKRGCTQDICHGSAAQGGSTSRRASPTRTCSTRRRSAPR